MTKTIRILAALAIVQAILAAVLLTSGNRLAGPAPGHPLLTFDPAGIDKIVIEDSHKARVVLQRHNGAWQTEDGFPADKYKAERLLKKLAGLKAGLPVSTSKDALGRFQLTDDDFQRRITLYSGSDTRGVLLLGNGAGARKTHARSGDSNQVVAIALGTYDTPVKTDDWRDKTVLQLKKDSIEKIAADGLTLTRKRDDKAASDNLALWTADPLPEGKVVNLKAIDQLVARLSSLRFDQWLGREAKPEYGLDHPILEFDVTANGKTRHYAIGQRKEKDKKDGDYILKVSDRDDYFTLPGYTVDSLKQKIGKDAWLMDKPAEPETTEDGKDANSAAPPEAGQAEKAETPLPATTP